MKKENQASFSDTFEKVGHNTTDGILPFTEKPALDAARKETGSKHKTAHSLFAYFTANIIKEEVTFIR